jgi:hypothetical protein
MNREESVEFAQKFLSDIVAFFGENLEVEAHVDVDAVVSRHDDVGRRGGAG